MAAPTDSIAERSGYWTDDRARAADEMARRIEADGIETVRVSFADQHGILRGKTLVAAEAVKALRGGVNIASTLLAKDTSHRTVFPVFTRGGGFGMREMQGAADVVMLPDPTTFRVLPWSPKTGWVLSDVLFPSGTPMPFSTRDVYRRVLGQLADTGYEFVAGLEVEFHLFKLEGGRLAPEDSGQPGRPPEFSLTTTGYQFLTELRYDQCEPILEALRRNAEALGLPVRSVEVEMGPSQFEFVFQPAAGLAPADTMVLFRSAAKQVAQRHGHHVTFMCRPRIPNVASSGWHLHQSLRDRRTGDNAFAGEGEGMLSPLALNYLGGLLAHARASAAFAAPTINAYRRYRPNSLAPDRATWGEDNRGVLVRAIGAPGDPATRLENRLGEPAANPYLYMASQVLAGMDGMARRLDPGPSADMPYETQATMLPSSLGEALEALRGDDCYRVGFGETFVDYYTHIKAAELARFQLEVTEWEQREYFEIF